MKLRPWEKVERMRSYVKRSHMRLVHHPSCGLHHAKECNAQHLERLDPKREVELEGTFTNHLADAIRPSGPTERQQAVDKATEAYEAALDEVLYELLDKRFAAQDSSEPTSSPDS
jgi:hypothetical protein